MARRFQLLPRLQRCFLRKPKGPNNQLQFLRQFPYYANESCEQVRNKLPVVDCPGSVCIKAVIKEAPAKRDVCVEGGAIVRDCWSRVMGSEAFPLFPPKTKKPHVRLVDPSWGDHPEETLGYIYTCHGFLCNSSTTYNYLRLIIVTLIFGGFWR
ncbi:unnamed protein product, partial [Mesorhabditis spiculigera]